MMGDLTRWVRRRRAAPGARVAGPRASRCRSRSTSRRRTSSTPALPDAVAERLAHYGVPGERLTCELSEHTVMADPRRAERGARAPARARRAALARRLRHRASPRSPTSSGCRSTRSRSTARSSPASPATTSDALIVRSTIDLARNLGLEVVAEGVERPRTCSSALRALRCHEAQGFHLSRPLPPEALVTGWRSGGRRRLSRSEAARSSSAAHARERRGLQPRRRGRPRCGGAGLSGTPSFAAVTPGERELAVVGVAAAPASATQRTARPLPGADASTRRSQPPARAASAATARGRGRPRRARAPSAGRRRGACARRGGRARRAEVVRPRRCRSAPPRRWRRARRRSAAASAASARRERDQRADAGRVVLGAGRGRDRVGVRHQDEEAVARACRARRSRCASGRCPGTRKRSRVDVRPAAAKRRATRSCARRSSRAAPRGAAPARASERANA